MNTKNPFNKKAGKLKPNKLATMKVVSGKKERKIEIDLDVVRQSPGLRGMDDSDLTIIALAVAKGIYSVGESALKSEKEEDKAPAKESKDKK